KMSLPAQPDWIFQVIAAAGDALATPPPAPPVAGDAAPPPAGALDERQAVMNAPTAESPVYFRNPRRELLSRSTCWTSNFPAHCGSRPFDARCFPLSRAGFRQAP